MPAGLSDSNRTGDKGDLLFSPIGSRVGAPGKTSKLFGELVESWPTPGSCPGLNVGANAGERVLGASFGDGVIELLSPAAVVGARTAGTVEGIDEPTPSSSVRLDDSNAPIVKTAIINPKHATTMEPYIAACNPNRTAGFVEV